MTIETKIYVALAVLVASWVGFCTQGHGNENWNTCEEAYAFCTRRPYHRDCAIWTHYENLLSVMRWHAVDNPAFYTQFCRENPWHMNCGIRSRYELYAEECPVPKSDG